MAHLIGNLTLNISTILYMVLYVPQLSHNNKKGQLSNLSLHFHNLLIISYTTDLMYGVGLSLPWQYILVSMVGTVCLFIQHKQLWKLYRNNSYFVFSSWCLFVFCALIPFVSFYKMPASLFVSIGYLSQVAGLLYTAPQIYKNIDTVGAALSLNITYLTLNLLSSACDNISAWALHWPTPSKLGSIVALLTCSILVIQWRFSRKQQIYMNDQQTS